MARPSCCTQLRQKVCMQVSSSGASYRLMQMAQVSSVMHRSSMLKVLIKYKRLWLGSPGLKNVLPSISGF